MTTLVESFAANTGQFSVSGIRSNTPGTLTITPPDGLVTSPFGGFGAGATQCKQLNFTLAAGPSLFISARPDFGTYLPPTPASGHYFNFSVGIFKDGNNFLVTEGGLQGGSSTVFGYDLLLFVGGVQFNLSSTTYTGAQFDNIGFGLVGNTATVWFSIGGVWQAVPALTVDVSSHIDFTAAGALTGYCASLGCFNDVPIPNAQGTIAYNELRLVQPFANPTTLATVPNVVGETKAQAEADIIAANLSIGTESTTFSATVPVGNVISQAPPGGAQVNFGSAVNAVISSGAALIQKYGKFVGSAVYPPTLLINAAGIKPRVWMPKENVTVKS